MLEEQSLLKKYQTERCEESFRGLVDSFHGMVQATASRRVSGSPHLIEDIVQNVFVDLAVEAFRMGPDMKIAGWLHRHTCFLASNFLRSERRRAARERSAVEMLEEQSTEPDWTRMEPELDAAIDDLSEVDREAILLRFFQKLSLKKTGAALGVSDDAAQKRIARAVDRLRKSFARRGIAVSTVALGAVLTKQALIAAPTIVSTGIAAHALTASAASSFGPAIAGTATLATTIMTKTSIIASVVTAAAIGVGGTYFYDQTKLEQRDEQLAQLRSQLDESEQRLDSVRAQNDTFANSQRMANADRLDLMRLRAEITKLRQLTNDLQLAAKNRTVDLAQPVSAVDTVSDSVPQEPESETVEQREYLPRDSWAFQGFAEPETAFESAVWAMNQGDLDSVSQAWTDEYLASRSGDLSGKTDEEIVTALQRDIAMAEGIKVVGQEQVSSVETIVQIEVTGTDVPPQVNARMKLVGNEWRFDGWAETARQPQR